jgi:hypothetical protein
VGLILFIIIGDMKKQTAVEWLIENLDIDLVDSQFTINQAKQMEREQIIEAAKYGNSFEQGDLRCEVYYNETYSK